MDNNRIFNGSNNGGDAPLGGENFGTSDSGQVGTPDNFSPNKQFDNPPTAADSLVNNGDPSIGNNPTKVQVGGGAYSVENVDPVSVNPAYGSLPTVNTEATYNEGIEPNGNQIYDLDQTDANTLNSGQEIVSHELAQDNNSMQTFDNNIATDGSISKNFVDPAIEDGLSKVSDNPPPVEGEIMDVADDTNNSEEVLYSDGAGETDTQFEATDFEDDIGVDQNVENVVKNNVVDSSEASQGPNGEGSESVENTNFKATDVDDVGEFGEKVGDECGFGVGDDSGFKLSDEVLNDLEAVNDDFAAEIEAQKDKESEDLKHGSLQVDDEKDEELDLKPIEADEKLTDIINLNLGNIEEFLKNNGKSYCDLKEKKESLNEIASKNKKAKEATLTDVGANDIRNEQLSQTDNILDNFELNSDLWEELNFSDEIQDKVKKRVKIEIKSFVKDSLIPLLEKIIK